MKIFSVTGITQSGKTTTIENIIKELIKRNYTVGSIKEIHFDDFKIDLEGTNTDRHKKAGSSLVTARGKFETDILHQEKMSINEILKDYSQDYVAMEGVRDTCAPKIVTAHDIKGIDDRLDETTFAISGRISNEITEYKGIPVINSQTDIKKLVDLIEEKVFNRLPDVRNECCHECGYTCKEMCANILNGKANRSDCVLSNDNITLKINGKEITIVPFVQKILKNSIEAVVKELDGYNKNGDIEICIKK